MADVATASPATARRLRVLRLRMAGLLGALLLVVVTVFAIAVLRLDDRLRAEHKQLQDNYAAIQQEAERMRKLKADLMSSIQANMGELSGSD